MMYDLYLTFQIQRHIRIRRCRPHSHSDPEGKLWRSDDGGQYWDWHLWRERLQAVEPIWDQRLSGICVLILTDILCIGCKLIDVDCYFVYNGLFLGGFLTDIETSVAAVWNESFWRIYFTEQNKNLCDEVWSKWVMLFLVPISCMHAIWIFS